MGPLALDPADADVARRAADFLATRGLHLSEDDAVALALELNGSWESDPDALENLRR